MDDIQGDLKYLFQTSNTLTFLVDGDGLAAMEAAFVNMVEPGERVILLENGVQRVREVAEKCGGVVTSLVRPIGEVFTLEEIEKALKAHSPSVLFLCHREMSTGVLHPLEGVGDLCHKYRCLLLVDIVASLGAVPLFMDKWGVDIAYCGSQKAPSCSLGASPISFSPRARAKLAARKTKVPSFFFDLNWLMKCWAVDETPRVLACKAPAKINLTLHVLGRRSDGYHKLSSLVAFAGYGDTLSVEIMPKGVERETNLQLTNKDLPSIILTVSGAFAAELSGDMVEPGNLVVLAATSFFTALSQQHSKLVNLAALQLKLNLQKNLPIAAGLGGGSADAAACLRLLEEWAIGQFGLGLGPMHLFELAAQLGSDVPVCLASHPAHMTGRGEHLVPFQLRCAAPLVLVNPKQKLSTQAVFAEFACQHAHHWDRVDDSTPPPFFSNVSELAAVAHWDANDLAAPAVTLCPIIRVIRCLLESAPGVLSCFMCGSGASVAALCESDYVASQLVEQLHHDQPDWWVMATQLKVS